MWYIKRDSRFGLHRYRGAYDWVEKLDDAVRFKSWDAVSEAAKKARESNDSVSIIHVRTRTSRLLSEMHKSWSSALARLHAAEMRIKQLEKQLAEERNPMEIRGDGKEVYKDRWESGIRNLASILGYSRSEFEIVDIVEKVRKMVEGPTSEAENS